MSNHAKALAFIKTLVEKFGKGGYIFRGTTTRYSLQKGEGKIRDGINSTLYRWVVKENKKGDIAEEQESLKKIFSENEFFSPARMEEEIAENAQEMSQIKNETHGVLTDLQHFGGKTNMIDFSHSMYVALFFACQSKFGKNGELIILREKDLQKIKKIDYTKSAKGLAIIEPAKTKDSQRRADSQQSVFVRPANGYINLYKCKIIEISAEIKQHILDYLREEEKIDHNFIYNDLHGFIKNEKNNETASLYFHLGRANQDKGDNEKAIVYYEKCVQSSPNMISAYNNLGNAYSDMGKHNLSIESFDKAITRNRNYANAYLGRGVAYARFNKNKRAIEDFDKAISLKPNFAQAYKNRGNAYASLGKNERAIEDFNNAILLMPKYATIYNGRGIAYLNMEKYKLAIKDFGKAVSLKPKYAEAYNNRGNAYFNLEENERAIKNYNKAILLNPNYAEAYYNRGQAYYIQKEDNRAMKDFEKAISLKPDFALAYQGRGCLKGEMGDMKGANADFEKALSLGLPPLNIKFF